MSHAGFKVTDERGYDMEGVGSHNQVRGNLKRKDGKDSELWQNYSVLLVKF